MTIEDDVRSLPTSDIDLFADEVPADPHLAYKELRDTGARHEVIGELAGRSRALPSSTPTTTATCAGR